MTGSQLADRIFVTLRHGFELSRLPVEELHVDYLLLGGAMDAVELEACLLGLLDTDPHEHNVAALALNEFFLGQPRFHLIAYREPAG